MTSERQTLERALIDFHWMARRYADGRQSYATSLFNDHTKALLALGIEFNETGDKTIWARDRDGRGYDGLTEQEANCGEPAPTWSQRDLAITALRNIRDGAYEGTAEQYADLILNGMEGTHDNRV